MSGMVYEWRSGERLPLEAQAAGDCLEAMRVRRNGRLTPHAVVEEASQARSPIHKAFDWDDASAAHKHRLAQARHLIAAIVVKLPEQAKDQAPVRAFVNVVTGEEQAYVSTAHALADSELRGQMLGQAFSELRAWQKRFKEYEELATLFDEIDAQAGRLGIPPPA